jgi:hypothetical protein
MAKNNVTHPVVILPDGKLEEYIGVSGFPSSAVFLNNELQWTGHPSSSTSALSKARKKASKKSVYPKKLSKVIKSMKKGEPIAAMLEVQKLKAKLSGPDASWATRFEKSLQTDCELAFAKADKAIEDGRWLAGIQMASPYLGKKSPFEGAPETGAKLEELKADKSYADEIAGGELFAKAKQHEAAKEYSDAVKVYKSILNKYDETKISAHALSSAEKLIEDRKPGFKDSCPNCRKNGGAACAKHHEKMKLKK